MIAAQTPVDEEAPWPRVRTTNGHTVTLHLPQEESWTSNSFNARAAVGLKMAGSKSEWLGVAWIGMELFSSRPAGRIVRQPSSLPT